MLQAGSPSHLGHRVKIKIKIGPQDRMPETLARHEVQVVGCNDTYRITDSAWMLLEGTGTATDSGTVDTSISRVRLGPGPRVKRERA